MPRKTDAAPGKQNAARKKKQPSSTPATAPIENERSTYDHDAAVARYLAQRGGEGQVGDVPAFVIFRPLQRRIFGRKHV